MRDAKYGEPIHIKVWWQIQKFSFDDCKIKDNVNISSNIEVFLGLTSKINMKRGIKDLKTKDALKISKIFIHPLLSTEEQFSKTPDLALVKLEEKIQFSKKTRPICLDKVVKEKPICEDSSMDRSK